MGVKSTPSNGGEIYPPNIELKHRTYNIPKKQSASSKDDGQNNDYQKEDSKAPINIHRQVSIIERRMKKNGVTEIDREELEVLFLEASSLGPEDEEKKEYGHAERVRDWALENAPPELDYDFEPEDEE